MLTLNNVSISYDKNIIIENISLKLKQGEIGCLLGPSGGGKTSILRAIAGLINIKNGEILIDNKIISTNKSATEIHKRKVGMLFQDYALFPHLNIEQNIGFGISKDANYKPKILDLLKMLEMESFAYKYPHELSGGQQQRIALARALAPQPKVLLLDEPFSSLDANLREKLAADIRLVLKECNMTALMVTHDQSEAFSMVDQVGVLYQKKLQQWDTPYNIYHEPCNEWMANFIGKGVFVNALSSGEYVDIELGRLKHNSILQGNVRVLLRADDIIHDDNSPIKAKVIYKNFHGADFLYTLGLDSGQQILAYVPSHHNHEIGEHIGIYLDVNHVMIFNQ
jgi:iron(III) transport system ATP-binding protein